MATETVISAYNAAIGSGGSRSDGSGSAEPDNLMKGRTFIPRMSENSRKLLIEALQKAKKKRQERLGRKREAGEIGSALSTNISEDQKTKADLALDEVTSDLRFRGTYNEQSGTTGTGVNAEVKTEDLVDPYNPLELEGYIVPKKANGGKIPRYNKKRTIKYRK